MGTKALSNIKLTDTLTMVECKDGYYLYDYTRGMHLSMRAKTQEDAFVEGISYYQKQLKKVEDSFRKLNTAVNTLIDTVSDE